ncbi:MAG: hypothetical protein IJL20_01345 [Lachnospiraceae bacterium]|nr:hypothetical protein [Lachnospiraceae bacterium]
MGTCLKCHKKIRDGQKYCDSCKQKMKNKADESYLDSLLSSVGINSSKVNTKTVSEAPAKPKTKAPAVKEQQPEEVDEMLSDLLADMDSAGPIEPEGDMIPEEDIENIFEEAEAYATLLGKQEEKTADGAKQPDDSLFNIEENIPEPVQEIPEETPAPGIPDAGGEELIDVEWKNGEAASESQADVDALFMDIDAGIGESAQEGLPDPDDSELHKINDTLQGENADMVSPHAAFSDFNPIDEEISVQPKKKKKKPGFFKRLFGNINEDVTPEMIEADRRAKQEEEEKALQAKEEKKRLAEEKKAEAEAEKARKKAEADAERNRKMALAMEKKAAAKEKEKQKREAALAIAEYEVEHGKINKAGATILFVIFAVLTIVIIIGSNIYSYNLSIKNAQEDFNVQKYNEAYYEVYGLKIKDEDIELYDRIMTVMFVNHQLNSYEYYMTSNNREKALDSLLKGLQRYEKYLQLAQILNITDDLNYVKSEILAELDKEFNMNEAEAYSLVEVDDSVDYSEYIYSLLGEYEGLDILE